jgi:hypothetical protein
VIPRKSSHVSQIQKAEAKSPVPPSIGETYQPSRNLFVLILEQGLVPEACFANAKCFTGKPNADVVAYNSFLRHLLALGWL